MAYEVMTIVTLADGTHVCEETWMPNEAKEFAHFVAHTHADFSIEVNNGNVQCYSIVCFETEG